VTVHSDRLVPCATPPDARIAHAARAACPRPTAIGSSTTSDWVFLNDVPTVKMGPGQSPRSHTADERISIAEVRCAVDVYQTLLQRYFGSH
jgi:acetylornithine deacetylase